MLPRMEGPEPAPSTGLWLALGVGVATLGVAAYFALAAREPLPTVIFALVSASAFSGWAKARARGRRDRS
jgi:hypothetical protein